VLRKYTLELEIVLSEEEEKTMDAARRAFAVNAASVPAEDGNVRDIPPEEFIDGPGVGINGN
jgi:hypothetical protein